MLINLAGKKSKLLWCGVQAHMLLLLPVPKLPQSEVSLPCAALCSGDMVSVPLNADKSLWGHMMT